MHWPSPERRRLVLGPRTVTGLAAAAAIVLVLGVGWWLVAGGSDAPVIRAAQLTTAPGLLRGAEATEFHSGERIWLHFETNKDGAAFVALLDALGRLVSVTADSTVPVQSGSNTIGPFTLDDETGTESIILVVTAVRDHTPQMLFQRLQDADAGADRKRSARLQAMIDVPATNDDLSVTTLTYRHLPAASPGGPEGP